MKIISKSLELVLSEVNVVYISCTTCKFTLQNKALGLCIEKC